MDANALWTDEYICLGGFMYAFTASLAQVPWVFMSWSVALAVRGLEVLPAADALHEPVGHDGDAPAHGVGLLHRVRGEQHAALLRRRLAPLQRTAARRGRAGAGLRRLRLPQSAAAVLCVPKELARLGSLSDAC